jgi:Flp pilus assembly protein TadG
MKPGATFPRSFIRDQSGAVALIAALAMPVLLMAALGAIELAQAIRTRAALQNYVDAAALAGAQAYAIDQSAATVERSRVQADRAADAVRPSWAVVTSAQSDPSKGAVTVSQEANRDSLFGTLVSSSGLKVRVTATAATLMQKIPLCVLGMQQKGGSVVKLSASATMTAGGCLVQSNTDIEVAGSPGLRAGGVRSVGGARGSIAPAPVTDAPPINDPFAALGIAVPATCSDRDFAVSGTTTLNPGVHCGRIRINGNDKLVLNPGEHYFADAHIDVVGKGQLVGNDVVLIFKGKVDIGFKGQAFLALEGRRSGPLAGFVMITDRSFTNAVELSTDSARKLLGTIYLPAAELRVSGTGNKIADQSPWTVVVANRLRVEGSAELVINSNYFASAVPVPKGVATNVSSRLVQ